MIQYITIVLILQHFIVCTYTLPVPPINLNPTNLPGQLNYSDKGYVTPVQNEKSCTSGWAFAATGAIEGQRFALTKKLVAVSPQNLIDCTTSYGNNGCNGGNVTGAYNYVINNGGLDSNKGYPYTGVPSNCKYNSFYNEAKVYGYMVVPPGNETTLQIALANYGPIAVQFIVTPSFNSYNGGIYYEPLCSSYFINYAFLLVGYGSEKAGDYWLIKNQWGTEWGIYGYAKIARNQGDLCGLTTFATIPIVYPITTLPVRNTTQISTAMTTQFNTYCCNFLQKYCCPRVNIANTCNSEPNIITLVVLLTWCYLLQYITHDYDEQ